MTGWAIHSRETFAYAPYLTNSGNDVMLLSGVVEDRRISDWLANGQGHQNDRVEIKCVGRFKGTMNAVGVRFRGHDEFSPRSNLRVAAVGDCRVLPKSDALD